MFANLKCGDGGKNQHNYRGEEEQGADDDQHPGGGGGVGVLEESPDDAPESGTAEPVKMINLR